MTSLFALAAAPACAQELPVGQSEAEYQAWLGSNPGNRGQVLSFEAWQQAAGVSGVIPTFQLIRTASMWRECNGPPFEIPPFRLWPGMARTLKFVRDHVRQAVGPVEAVSGYRNPALNACARGSERSAHLDFFALDLIPVQPLPRRQLFERLCAMHSRDGPAAGAGLGFYTFQRFHIDTRSFRRWGSAGPQGNESPCAVLERGGDPEAPPLPPVIVPVVVQPAPPAAPPPQPGPQPPRPQYPAIVVTISDSSSIYLGARLRDFASSIAIGRKTMPQEERRAGISFEDFTTSTLRAVRAALDTKPGGPRTFCEPEILIGIVVRPPRDIPDIGSINTTSTR